MKQLRLSPKRADCFLPSVPSDYDKKTPGYN